MISEDYKRDVVKINELSLRLNGSKEKEDNYTLSSMIEHASEIKKLYENNNPHWALETGDLMIHCMRLLTANGCNIDKIFEKCVERFITKISKKLREQSDE